MACRNRSTTRAPAKINLTLHVLGRRAGRLSRARKPRRLRRRRRHADASSRASGLALSVEGPTAPLPGPSSDNLVLRAARASRRARPRPATSARFHLVKRLPVAAGIGGGSSDAAAALRLLARLNGLSAAPIRACREAARLAGADVPVCLDPRARMMRGRRRRARAAARACRRSLRFWSIPACRSRRRRCSGRSGSAPGETLPGGRIRCRRRSAAERSSTLLASARNDLEPPALRVEPVDRRGARALLARPARLPARAHVGLRRDRVRAVRGLPRRRRGRAGHRAGRVGKARGWLRSAVTGRAARSVRSRMGAATQRPGSRAAG